MTPFTSEDFKKDSTFKILVDEFDALYFWSKQFMALLMKKDASGVTATAMKTDLGGKLEEYLYKHLGFDVVNLFSDISFPSAIDFSGRTYEDFREEIL